MNKFLKDRNYLLKYSIGHSLLFLSFITLLYLVKGVDLSFNFYAKDSLYVILALALCGLPSSVLHNCAHRNVGPRKVNDFIGEFLGTVMLYGYRGFSLGHMFHHKFPDNPEFDPHPPRGYSFFRFVLSPIKATLIIIERAYFNEFGKSEKTIRNITFQKIFFNLSILLKVVFWLLVFDLKLFVIFYLVLYISNIFVFAHINFATHVEDDQGHSEIINLDNNLYYKFVNIVSFGGYFHKNHHLRPRVFNPSKINNSLLPLKTYKPKVYLGESRDRKIFDFSFVNGLNEITKKLELDK